MPRGVGETASRRQLPQRGPGWPPAERGPRPHRCPQARQGPPGLGCARRRQAPTGTGRPSLHSIVFLNAFMNNSERKYYSLAGSQGPARCCSVGLGAAKANTLPASPRFSPVFQINRCLTQRALRPPLPGWGAGGPSVSKVAGYLQHCCPAYLGCPGTHRRAPGLGWPRAPLPLRATLEGGHAERSPRAAGPQTPAWGNYLPLRATTVLSAWICIVSL